MSVEIANSAETIANLNSRDVIRFFRETDSITAFLPLAYTSGTEFTQTGTFFTAFEIHVDALTSFTLSLNDRFTVQFTDGRGTLDIRTIPGG